MRQFLVSVFMGLQLAGAAASASEIRDPAPLPVAEPSFLQRGADLLIARPVAAVRLAGGIVMLPLTLPVAALLGDPGWALEVCVTAPLEDLARSPLTHP